MRRQRAFRIASWFALVTWVGMTIAALSVATFGVIGLAGWGDYRYEVTIPGLPLYMNFQPSWEANHAADVCDKDELISWMKQPDRDFDSECYNITFTHGQERPGTYGFPETDADVQPVRGEMSGPLFLDADPGWDPLMASLYGMQVLAMLVVAFVIAQLWLLLRSAARDRGFTGPMVRRLRIMGWTLVGWELAEPFLWLFFSPKGNDYSYFNHGPGIHVELGSMEPGGPSLIVIAFGLLLVLLAELFRHGAEMSDEQKLTV